MNPQIDISKLEQAYKDRAKTIFTQDNIAAIVFHLNRLIPNPFPLTRDSEFSTLVACAKVDGMKELVELVKTNVLGNKQKDK